MRFMRGLSLHLSALLAGCIFLAPVALALLAPPCVHAAPPRSSALAGAVGGEWRPVDPPFLAGQRINALLPDGRAGMWAGAEERGLAQWDGRNWRTYGPREGLPDSRVVALFLDRQGRLWVSTGGGLGYLSANGLFRRIGVHGLRSLPVLAIAEAPDGAILFGSAEGLDRWQAGDRLEAVPQLDGVAVVALLVDRNGTVWAGTSAGLWREVEGEWLRESALGAGRVAALAQDASGQLYAAGDRGLWQLAGGAWRKLEPPGSVAPAAGEVAALSLRDGAVWLGTPQGLSAVQTDVWERYDPALLPQARVTALAWSNDGLLWVGTTGGLVTYQPDSTPPNVAIVAVNGLRPGPGSVRLASDTLDRLQIGVADRSTPANRLHFFTRLEGVDLSPRLLSAAEAGDLNALAVYAGRPLPPGPHVLRVWAQDDAFNRSAESQVTLIVPALTHAPGGLTLPREAAFASMAGLALVLTGGATTAAARRTRRRQAEHGARSAAERLRAVADRSDELYADRLPLREGQVQEAVGALHGRNILLLGRRGMGKTVTLDRIALALPVSGQRSVLVAPAAVDLGTVAGGELFHALMSAATDALYPHGAGVRPRLLWNEGATSEYREDQFSADLGVLLAWLQPQAGRRLILVFLLDNTEAVDGYEASRRDAFRRLVVAASGASSSIRLVLAAETTPDVLAGFEDLFHTVVLTPLDGRAAATLLRDGASGLLDWEPDAERLAIARAGGSPAKLANLGRVAGHNALASNRLRITGADVP